MGTAALAVGAIPGAAMAAVGMADMHHSQHQHRQEDESYQ